MLISRADPQRVDAYGLLLAWAPISADGGGGWACLLVWACQHHPVEGAEGIIRCRWQWCRYRADLITIDTDADTRQRVWGLAARELPHLSEAEHAALATLPMALR